MVERAELEELAGALERDPRRVADETARLAAALRTDGGRGLLSRCLALGGRAYRLLGEIDRAEHALRQAVATAPEDDDEAVADAHLGLAAVLAYSSRADEALGLLDVVTERGSEQQRAHGQLQRASISQRLGFVHDALAQYESALPVLRAAGATIDVARVLQNRGVVAAGAGRAAQAVDDFAEAATLFTEAGQHFGAVQATHNLGWAAARLGDLPRALAAFDRARSAFAALDHPAPEAEIDRAEVLLAAGLSQDALALAADTAATLLGMGNRSLAAQARLLCAQAARMEGDAGAALAHAEAARELFAQQQAPGWERAAQLEVLRIRDADSALTPADTAELRNLAHDLAEAGDATGEVTALALAAVAAAGSAGAGTAPGEAAADLAVARDLAARCAARAAQLGSVEVRLLAARALAEAALGAGDGPGALGHVQVGLDELDRFQETLGATDARAHVSGHARSLTRLGLRLALAERNAEVALAWMERSRARSLRLPPSHPPDDEVLAAELAELRGVAAALRQAELDGEDTADLRRRQTALEDEVRRRHLRTAGATVERRDQPPRAADVQLALAGTGSLVCAAIVGDHLHAVVVDGRGSRLADLGRADQVLRAAADATSASRALALPRPGPAPGARVRMREDAMAALEGSFLAPLTLPPGPVVLVLPGPFHTVPWRLAPSLVSRAVTVAPSVGWWLRAGPPPAVPSPGAPLVVAGPRLVEGEGEALAVARCHRNSVLLTGEGATVPAVMAALPAASLAHVVAHGRFRHDNALWSSVELADGPLTVYELERLPALPPTVVLSACEAGLSAVRPGDELLGLAAAVLHAGTRSLVAPVCPIPDSPAICSVMVALHRELAAGVPAAEALASLPVSGAGGMDLAAALTCFGR